MPCDRPKNLPLQARPFILTPLKINRACEQLNIVFGITIGADGTGMRIDAEIFSRSRMSYNTGMVSAFDSTALLYFIPIYSGIPYSTLNYNETLNYIGDVCNVL